MFIQKFSKITATSQSIQQLLVFFLLAGDSISVLYILQDIRQKKTFIIDLRQVPQAQICGKHCLHSQFECGHYVFAPTGVSCNRLGQHSCLRCKVSLCIFQFQIFFNPHTPPPVLGLLKAIINLQRSLNIIQFSLCILEIVELNWESSVTSQRSSGLLAQELTLVHLSFEYYQLSAFIPHVYGEHSEQSDRSLFQLMSKCTCLGEFE